MEVKKRCWVRFFDWLYAVTNNESLPFWISLPLPAIVEILLSALSPPVSRTPPVPCSPGLPPPCKYGIKMKVFPVHDCTQELYYFSSIVRRCKWPSLSRSSNYHGDLTSHFSQSLFRRASLVINTAECLKTYTKMNGVLTLFVLAESTQVKWYKCLRL